MFDKFTNLAMQAHDSLCLCILANPDVTDLELVNVRVAWPLPEDTSREYEARQLGFIGVMGVVDGLPRTALDIPLDPVRISALSAAFVKHCELLLSGAFEAQGKGDSVDWLMRLFSLPDERPEG